MICIRVCNKKRGGEKGRGIRSIHELVVKGTFEIAKEVLDSCPMSGARVGTEPCKYSHRIGNVCVECMKNGIMFDVAKSHFMFVWSSVTLCRTGDSVRFNILNTHIVHQVCST